MLSTRTCIKRYTEVQRGKERYEGINEYRGKELGIIDMGYKNDLERCYYYIDWRVLLNVLCIMYVSSDYLSSCDML